MKELQAAIVYVGLKEVKKARATEHLKCNELFSYSLRTSSDKPYYKIWLQLANFDMIGKISEEGGIGFTVLQYWAFFMGFRGPVSSSSVVCSFFFLLADDIR